MEDVPDASTQLHSTLKFYVDEFRQIQESVKAHLNGSSCNEPPLLPAFLPPSSYWTSSEKDLFFHGLSVYSRLQPELIAQHVKTKSTFDVCVYLEVLRRATEVVEEEDGDGTDNSLRGEVEYAMEVSEKWVRREEAISESLMALDTCPCSLEGSNSKLVEKCTCRSTSDEDSGSQEVKCHNNYLNHLDPTCLMVLEMIRREGENESHPDGAQSLGEERQRSNSVLDRQGSLLDENYPASEPTEVASNVDQEMPISSSRNPSPRPDKAQLRRIQKRLYMRRKRAEAVGKAVNTDAVKLRPGRAAKDRKPPKPRPKTYKPRKVQGDRLMDASQNGGEKDDLKVDEDAQTSASSKRSPSYQPEVSENEDEHGRQTKGGLTRPYKLKKSFHESGITTQTLSEMGLDFFNLTELGKFLRLNNSLNAPSRKRDVISLSVDSIQMLREMIKEFSFEVIQRAIIMKDQEIRLKSNLKVWKYDRQEVSVENMLECLKTMGLDQLTKEQYFSDLVYDNHEEGSSEEMPASEDEESTVSDDQSASESGEGSPAQDSPPSHPSPSESSLHPFPSPSPPLSYLSNLTYCLFSEGDVLSSDIDEAEVTKELAEEDILDVLDIVQSKKYEKNLWETHS